MHFKSYSHFFSKKFWRICVSLDVNFNESITNDIVSFEQLGLGWLMMSHIIWIYPVCHSVFDFRLKHLFALVDKSKLALLKLRDKVFNHQLRTSHLFNTGTSSWSALNSALLHNIATRARASQVGSFLL